MKSDVKIIFLDIDGVLNGFNKREYLLYLIWKKMPIPYIKKIIRTISKFSSIDESRVKHLAKICRKTGAKIVLSSSWRNNLLSDDGKRLEKYDNHKLFWNLMDKYHLDVIDKTPSNISARNREDEIIQWLCRNQDKYHEIKYIILDDESSHLQCFVNSNLIKTSYEEYNGSISCKIHRWVGLNRKHVKLAIKKLNR